MKILITGGAGFIGSAMIRYIIKHTKDSVVNLDKLTYAGNVESLYEVSENERYVFEQSDICDIRKLRNIIQTHQPDSIMHLAAESHVDRSIDGPAEFIQTNIVGTYNLLDVARDYWQELDKNRKSKFRFHHISTDEVYGDLQDDETLFEETTPYDPSSPYAASKASSDHLVRAWYKTYGLPVVITNCSNNYGPFQFPEKLIPLMILNAIDGKPLPVYGSGSQVRDWLYVEDHVRALYMVLKDAETGKTYNIGGYNERRNIDIVNTICEVLEEMVPDKPHGVNYYKDLIVFVEDRPGHDIRYAIDASKINQELGWHPIESLETGIYKTVQWYLDHNKWWSRVLDGSYHGERLGLGN